MPEQLSHQFSETFTNDIWETALSGNNLLISCREGERMEVTFSLYDLGQKAFRWKSISFDESWWLSVYAFAGDIIVFQIFNDSQNMEARSLFGFDINSQEALWSVDDVNVLGCTGQLIRLKPQTDDAETFYVNIKTGELAESLSSEINKKNVSNGILLPFHYTEESEHFLTAKHFLAQFAQVNLVGACDYLEYKGLIMISVHEKLEQNLTNSLLVFDSAGHLILKEVLAEHSKGLASDTFYIVNEALIFVKEKREIKGYLIENL